MKSAEMGVGSWTCTVSCDRNGGRIMNLRHGSGISQSRPHLPRMAQSELGGQRPNRLEPDRPRYQTTVTSAG